MRYEQLRMKKLYFWETQNFFAAIIIKSYLTIFENDLKIIWTILRINEFLHNWKTSMHEIFCKGKKCKLWIKLICCYKIVHKWHQLTRLRKLIAAMVCFYDTTYTSQVDNAFSESKSSYSRKDRNKVHLQEFYIRMCSSAGVRRTRSRHRLQLETQLHQFERIRARAEKLKAKITIIFIQHFLCGEKSNSRSRSQWKQRPLKFHLSLSRPMPQWNWLHVYS